MMLGQLTLARFGKSIKKKCNLYVQDRGRKLFFEIFILMYEIF